MKDNKPNISQANEEVERAQKILLDSYFKKIEKVYEDSTSTQKNYLLSNIK